MKKLICTHDECTGCAACRDICPKHCISMQKDELDSLYPVIDESLCINCGLCEKTCPNNINLLFHKTQKVFVAWSNNNDIRKTSASGGIAYELYRYWIRKGGVATGVIYNREKGCYFVLLEKEHDIPATQNSKYTFSNTNGIYQLVKQKLQNNIPVLFIGMPCQIAGLMGFLKKKYKNLITVDIICHGMPPASYLEQHIRVIESLKKQRTSNLSFRDPQYYTYTFTFTLRDSHNKTFYNKKVLSNDNYQLGYHKALIYRENCYSCHYARKERIADLTIGDFSGLGRFAPFEFDKHNVSCILQNSHEGEILLTEMKNQITMYERPPEEAFEIEHQLKTPSIKHKKRDDFEREYIKNKCFEKAANLSLALEKRNAIKVAFIIKIKIFLHNILLFLHIKNR